MDGDSYVEGANSSLHLLVITRLECNPCGVITADCTSVEHEIAGMNFSQNQMPSDG